MIGDDVEVTKRDPYGYCGDYEFNDPKLSTKHGYACPICDTIISLCQDAALVAELISQFDKPFDPSFRVLHDFTSDDPNKTQPSILTVEEVIASETSSEIGFLMT